MSSPPITTVEVEVKAVLDMDQAAALTKGISELIEQIAGPVGHTAKAVAPFDQTWKEISFGRVVQ